jgi:hypothetical protein
MPGLIRPHQNLPTLSRWRAGKRHQQKRSESTPKLIARSTCFSYCATGHVARFPQPSGERKQISSKEGIFNQISETAPGGLETPTEDIAAYPFLQDGSRSAVMTDNVLKFPGPDGGWISHGPSELEEAPAKPLWRAREHLQEEISRHTAGPGRPTDRQAVAWEAAAESGNLSPAQIEEARKRTAVAFEEMQLRGRMLLVAMPTDPRGLVDLLMYLEKNFSILPQESCGRSLAFDLLRAPFTRYGRAELPATERPAARLIPGAILPEIL